MNNTGSNVPPGVGSNWLDVVRQHVESLHFGAVEIIVHDSRVIQIEKTERMRFGKTSSAQPNESDKSDAGNQSPKK